MGERLVVIGMDAAGASAASQARRLRDEDSLEILAFERSPHTSYSACGIPYWIGGVVENQDALIARGPDAHRRRGIDVRTGHEVVGIDLDARSVTVRGPGAAEERHGFDQLVVATGATPVAPRWPGADARGVHGVQTLADGEAVHRTLDRGARRAVVVGGGYIGVEMAEAMVQRGLKVVLVEQGEQPMNTLDPDMGALVRDAMCGLGIEVRTGVSVTGFEAGEDGWVRAVATDDGEVPADVVLLGLGARPNSALAADAGIRLGPSGGIVTDKRMRVPGVAGVWAAGDCVEVTHRVTGRSVAIALGTHANKQGRVAGVNIGGGYATFPGVVGTAMSKVCALEIARTGLRERDAEEAGFAFVTATITSDARAGYYPGAERMTVKLLAERGTGRLLGGQIVGREGSAKRIDTLAVALWNEMTVDEITGLDLGYAPPFSPVWDPVLVAARKAASAVHA
ncbi:MAG TPA: FAD-dependent oxidoreductase [Cryptosporangiaceae bacterium]|nr:FAD-dependent oxidoreductase [Cryptosporangiaceae bacterium]